MTGNYFIVDPSSSLVSASTPYSRSFLSPRSSSTNPYLTMAVKTAYSTNASAASVRINGVELGKVRPRPWVNHSFIDDEAITLIFDYSILTNVGLPWLPALNTLTVVPQSGTYDYLFVSDVIYHFTT